MVIIEMYGSYHFWHDERKAKINEELNKFLPKGYCSSRKDVVLSYISSGVIDMNQQSSEYIKVLGCPSSLRNKIISVLTPLGYRLQVITCN